MNNRKSLRNFLPYLLLIFSGVLIITSCGGGGGGGQVDSPTPTSPPNAEPSQLTLGISPASLPDDIPYTPYNQMVTMTASGGKLPYRTFSCTVSNAPELNTIVERQNTMSPTGTCNIFGTPTKDGTYTATFTVVDDAQAVVSVSTSIICKNQAPSGQSVPL
jgi:hypothetical protein